MPVTSLSPSFWKPSNSPSAESIVAEASRPTYSTRTGPLWPLA
jgi:hypothetical protein